MYQVAIKKEDNFYYFHFDDPIMLVCILVDYAESKVMNLTWDDILSVIFDLKIKLEKEKTLTYTCK